MGMLFKKIVMVESLPVVFMGAGAGVGAGKKKYLEPVKDGPAPQHCTQLATSIITHK